VCCACVCVCTCVCVRDVVLIYVAPLEQFGTNHDDSTFRHDETVPKFGGLQDLPTVTHLTNSHPSSTGEEEDEEKEEDETSDEQKSNPVTYPLVEPAGQVSRTG